MDFGDLPRTRDFDPALAEIHPGSEKLLGKFPPLDPGDLPVFLGAPQWTIPGHCRTLPDYVRTWNSIELNTAFYRVPTPEAARAWAGETPEDFSFFVKAHKDLSHEFALWGDRRAMAERMRAFTEGWRGLGGKWAGSFLQLPPGLGFDRLALLGTWLAGWSGPPLFVEFRHASWFEGRQLRREAARVLAEARVGLVCTDTPGRRDASHGTLTTPDLFVRFLGQALESDTAPLALDLERLDGWIGRIEALRARGLRKLIFFLHTPDLHWVPEFTRIFSEKLRALGYAVASPERKPDSSPQLSLF